MSCSQLVKALVNGKRITKQCEHGKVLVSGYCPIHDPEIQRRKKADAATKSELAKKYAQAWKLDAFSESLEFEIAGWMKKNEPDTYKRIMKLMMEDDKFQAIFRESLPHKEFRVV